MQPASGKGKNFEVNGQEAEIHQGAKVEVNIDMRAQLNRAAEQLNDREYEMIAKFEKMKREGKW